MEFGGSDQLFNLLVGRELQQEMGQRPQSCFVMRLLVGTDGAQKMSKSLGNTIDLEDSPSEQYGKAMSVPDSALPDYLELATDVGEEELQYLCKQLEERAVNPMEIKKRLAREIVAMFHGEAAAQGAEAAWERVFSKRVLPEHAEVARPGPLVSLLVDAGLAPSKAEARRLVKQGAVEIDGQKVSLESGDLVAPAGSTIRVGKHRFLRIVDSDGSAL